ncbi:MAG TPA: hypothetical protein VGO25_14050 [Rhodanobacteraceae bacterium]|jgi:hypothetical protein|nr:hypothetical protein [Rhodanobacteraceae bacterium]
MKRWCIVLIALSLAGCQDLQRKPSGAAHAKAPAQALQGEFDNHEQAWLAHENAPGNVPPPHVVVSIDPTSHADWTIWHVRLDASPQLEATWAMHSSADSKGTPVWIPHRALEATTAPASAFDAKQWTALDACALRGAIGQRMDADVAGCTAIAPGIGTQASLLPLSVEHDGEWLHVRLYADQARGADAREDARLVRWFKGWAAVNGGGPKAEATNRDWHMDRGVRIGSEGGRFALKWRDGSPTGYSLSLERLTYREGNVPVLKLSVIEDADGHALVYAWANPEATRIGINLGWVQVGLDLDSGATATNAK